MRSRLWSTLAASAALSLVMSGIAVAAPATRSVVDDGVLDSALDTRDLRRAEPARQRRK